MSVTVHVDSRGTVPAEQVGTVGHTTVRETLAAWATDRIAGLGFRFGHEAFRALGFSRRSPKYERKQGKLFGTTLPFTGARTGEHFGDRAVLPGVGHRVSPLGTGNIGEALLTVAAPRSMRKPAYLAEWSRLAPSEEAALLDRLERTMGTKMQEAIDGRA